MVSTETFNYDAAGNITDAPDSCFEYDTNNRLTTFKGSSVSYDMDGNMLSNGSLTCTYDSANRLITAGGHTYTYNAEDVRIRNLCEDEDTTYTYNTNAKLSMLLMKTTNGVVTKYVYGKGLIGEEVSGAFKTYHFDFRGSTIAITNASGNITDTFAYDTYGKQIARTGTNTIIFGYNGRDGVITDDNGLIYMRARYYSPDMKRFINADIVAGKLSNAVTLNRFAYANGNPVSFVDPFGLSIDYKSGDNEVEYTWSEMGFVYDGSMRDFRRLEQGLPPYSYEVWFRNNYSAYWEILLGENDAIYVANYGPNGLDVVGHAYVFLKKSDGTWIKTEFAAIGETNLEAKKNSKVSIKEVNALDIINALSVELETIKFEHTINITDNYSIVATIDTNYYCEGVQYYPIKGDFSDSVSFAQKHEGEKYNNYYFLLTNNCLHYVQDALKQGTANDADVELFIHSSETIVPSDFYSGLNSLS